MDLGLKGKRAIVTGGSRGIGRRAVDLLAAEGCDVGFCARSAAEVEDAVAVLQSHDWPGNVRQLKNVIDWILIMAPGKAEEMVRAEMLPPEIREATPTRLNWGEGSEILGLPLREAREVFERQYLNAQVGRFGGNISKTASFVGMERTALHRKLKSLGVAAVDRNEKISS